MADYISREAARKELLDWCIITGYGGLTKYDVHTALDNIPAADVVEVVYGKWLRTPTWWVYCSVCGCEPPQETNATTRFCPNCGAKMDGGDRDG